MNILLEDFMNQMIHSVPGLKDYKDLCFSYWAPDSPPDTILFSELGDGIINLFESMDNKAKEEIFELIERGVTSNDDLIGTVFATGLVEALVGATCKDDKLWKEIEKNLGDRRCGLSWVTPVRAPAGRRKRSNLC